MLVVLLLLVVGVMLGRQLVVHLLLLSEVSPGVSLVLREALVRNGLLVGLIYNYFAYLLLDHVLL